MQKVAIIDDFEESCSLMAEILSPYYQCNYVCQADKALDFINTFKPDLILMDYKMPYVTGVELCKVIKEDPQLKQTPVIFVSGAVTSDERIETLESGGDDFISKPFHPKELILRVQKRLQDRTPAAGMQNAVLIVGNLKVNISSRLVYVDDKEITLTPKQFEILKMLVDSKNNVVSRVDFMKEIWGHSDVTPRNVDSQINYLKKKIAGFNGQITAVPSHGYRLDFK